MTRRWLPAYVEAGRWEPWEDRILRAARDLDDAATRLSHRRRSAIRDRARRARIPWAIVKEAVPRWTPEEDAIVRADRAPYTESAARTGRTRDACKVRACRLRKRP